MLKKLKNFALLTMTISLGLTIGVLNANASTMNDKFDNMRLKWENYLIGDTSGYASDQKIKNAISANDKKTESIWKSINKSNNSPYLWEDLKTYMESAQITRSYDNLETMAVSYRTEGSKYYKNEQLKSDILYGLKWLYKNKYNEKKEVVANWWDYEVGAPTNLNDIIVLLYNEIPSQDKTNYLKAIKHFTPNAKYFTYYKGRELTPANILYKAKVVMVHAVLTKDEKELDDMRKVVSTVYKNTNTGAGFYNDGSFIEHKYFGYNGGYGAVMLKISSEMVMFFEHTKWQYTSTEKNFISNWIEKSFEPFIYKGVFLDMVRGRQIATQDVHAARSSVISTLLLSDYVNEPYKTHFKSLVKGWNRQSGINYSTDTVYNVKMQERLYNNPFIVPAASYAKYQTFGAMDRVLHGNGSYLFGISMSSSRIASYESINGENLKGWYTSQGMTYLYNGNASQYSGSYWLTVDKTRLSGTTIEQKPLKNKYGSGYLNKVNWVGGSQLFSKYGSAGMEIGTYGSTLTGKKSWFMFDNEIVALGTDLTNQSNNHVETIIDNRKVSTDAKTTVDKNWIQISDPSAQSDIGYYFPTTQKVNTKKETRTGKISDIDLYKKGDVKTDNYFTMWYDHGKNIKNGSYSYAILPNKSVNAVKEYAAKPEYKVLKNNSSVQAVTEYTTKTTGMNFWKKATVGDVTSYQPSSITMQDKDGMLSLGVSDPTQKQSKVMVELNKVGIKKIEGNTSVKVLRMYPTIQLEVDTKGKLGSSQYIKIAYDVNHTVEKIYVDEDTFTRNGSYKEMNFGSKDNFEVKNSTSGYTRKSFIKFRLNNNDNSKITYATLYIKGNVSDKNGETSTVSLYSTSSSWSEKTLNWFNKPYLQKKITDVKLDSSLKEREFDVTSFLKSSKNTFQSFALVQEKMDNATFFQSKESSNKPYLIIVKEK